MNRSVLGRLVAKDLYLYRWLIVGTGVAGLVSIFLSGLGGAAGMVGQILFITGIVVLGVFLAIHGLLSERQSGSLIFALSLPVSPLQYTLAKISACLIAFLIPWSLLLAVIVGITLGFDPPADGRIPLVVTMMVFLLANFCVLLAIGVVTGSELWSVAGIIATNTAVPVFLGTVLPSLVEDVGGPVPVWTPAVLATLAIAAMVMLLSLGLALFVQSRRRDFV